MPTTSSTPAPPMGPLAAATAQANPFNAEAGGIIAPGASAPINNGPHTPKNALIALGGEVLFVLAASVIAGTGPKAGSAMVALFVVLWVLFLINHYGK